MRFPLTLLPVLLCTASLVAQAPAAADHARQLSRALDAAQAARIQAAGSCPVRFSVDRQPQGAVIDTSGLGDWSMRQGDSTLDQQKRALRQEPGFSQLTPQQQQAKLDQLTRIYLSSHPRGQGLGVTVVDEHNPIVSADIVAYGYSGAAHVIPAVPTQPQQISETLHLTASAGHPLVEYTVWADRLAMVNRIELTRIDYADGTTWQPSSASHCSASPSLFVLVDSVAR